MDSSSDWVHGREACHELIHQLCHPTLRGRNEFESGDAGMKYATVLILILLPVLALGETVTETKQLELSSAGIEVLTIRSGAGFLHVQSAAASEKINIKADIQIEIGQNENIREFINDHVILSLEKIGTLAILQSKIKAQPKAAAARINVTISLPRSMQVSIIDGSGPIRVSDLSANIKIDDGSGSITIENIVGNLKIDDGSGNIRLEDIRGSIDIKDGSGSIQIDGIMGDVRITDGSGSVLIQHVDGNVTLAVYSGSIDISDITKNVFIRQSGTGDLEIDRVKGKIITHD